MITTTHTTVHTFDISNCICGSKREPFLTDRMWYYSNGSVNTTCKDCGLSMTEETRECYGDKGILSLAHTVVNRWNRVMSIKEK